MGGQRIAALQLPSYDKLHDIQKENTTLEDLQVLHNQVEQAIRSLKGGKFPGADNVTRVDQRWWKRDSEGFYHTMTKDLGNQAVATRKDAVPGCFLA